MLFMEGEFTREDEEAVVEVGGQESVSFFCLNGLYVGRGKLVGLWTAWSLHSSVGAPFVDGSHLAMRGIAYLFSFVSVLSARQSGL